MAAKESLTELTARLNGRSELLTDLDVLYRLHLSGEGGGNFDLSIRGGQAALTEAGSEPATAEVSLSATDFLSLSQGQTSGMALFMAGRIKVEGDLGTALKLESLLRS